MSKKEYLKEWRIKNKDHRKEYMRKWSEEHKEERKEYRKSRRKQENLVTQMRLDEWSKLFNNPSYCEVCGKEIEFNSKDTSKSIHFDHRMGGSEAIQGRPSQWLRGRKRNKENEKIWKSCNFGILCQTCNSFLPTKNRIEFLTNALKYASGSGIYTPI